MAEEICDSKLSLAELAAPVKLYPQYMKNVRVSDKDGVMSDPSVIESVKKVEELIDGKGRALLRPSGTEPLIRVMIEAEDDEKCREYANIIANAIIDGGYEIEKAD